MTARPLILILAGGFALAPLALAKEMRSVGGGSGSGGGSTQSQSVGSSSGGSSMQSYEPSSSFVHLAMSAVAEDHAVSHGSGGSGTVSYSRGGGSSSSGGTVSHSRAGGSSSSGSRSYSKSGTTAERRHPRAGTGTGGHGRSGYYRGGRYYPYSPNYGYYPGWGWGSYWWPYGSYYDGWYGGGYWGYPYGGWGPTHYNVHRDTGSVRVLVDPSEARVYVDGYYAGTVDDFDGLFQRLNVSPGRHEITLKLEGYKTHRMKVYVPFDSTLKLHYNMEKGSGESFEDLAANVPERELQRERERDQEESEQQQEQSDDERGVAPATLRLSVAPPDASVYVDGTFRGTAREAASLALPPGHHKIEIVRPGYRTVEREVETTAGEPTEVTIALDPDKTSI
jgi:hypothetical protein